MSHPSGGKGKTFSTRNTFLKAHTFVGTNGVTFKSTTGKVIFARRSIAGDKITKTIMFKSENSYQGNVCECCWGFRKNCSGSRIGHLSEALDQFIP